MYARDSSDLKQIILFNTFRKLWEQHVVWTRAFVISSAEDLADIEFVTERLLRNPADFAEALEVYYGEKVAGDFERLLTDHLLIAAEIVNAIKTGDTQTAQEQRVKWFQNADDIAALLAAINPYWDERQWREMLYQHLELLEDQIAFRFGGRYREDVRIFDSIEEQALMMGDTMARGIINQFKIF